ncbi:hypothetical protein [Vibrio harveyi]|uniref:hypothetical protein n=1 Tax=Vibrio harveyi TaxID=669 RepID=UPI0005EEE5FD|nr:hypothetical protein [Vibrio harveyi]
MAYKKHVILCAGNDTFSPLFIDSLVNKVGVDIDKICVVFFDSKFDLKLNDGKSNYIEYVKYSSVDIDFWMSSESITFISLSSFNSSYIREVMELCPDFRDKMYMFLTDDELERWFICREEKGMLTPSTKLCISEDDLWVIRNLKNVIALKGAFYEKLSEFISPDVLNVIDASVIFDTIPSKQAEYLRKAICLDNTGSKNNSILIGSKPNAFNFDEVKSILRACIDKGVHKSSKFVVMWPKKQWRKRASLIFYLLYLNKIKKEVVDLTVITSMSSIAYTAMVMSNTHLILQPRGGVSSARLFMKWAQGVVCIRKGAPNEHLYKDVQSINILSYESFDDLAERIYEPIDIEANALKINEEEKRSIRTLSGLYC